MERLEKKFEGYTVEIETPDKQNFDPANEAVEVVITTKSGARYHANFITRDYENYLFEKNTRTGECVSGTYLWIPSRISVREISEEVVRRTVDDLIRNLEIEKAFEKID